eukprot:CAMPEP_0202831418 /NCGR_PEP_ID=MMETSP1389-20130828/16844_1 /ASSEMBLY_ACC=CAM_ASM_000865 /TAXON_ID=302021 /ORGANISM="Rhodomonas sp., Strain CCMP768" /LENGTH=56 /DNA_ID=CAMNT_0049505165 /DNA_START=59 /DNA_END=226 /DNA_ORIENTATION=-
MNLHRVTYASPPTSCITSSLPIRDSSAIRAIAAPSSLSVSGDSVRSTTSGVARGSC